jgi:hypothetical protein
MLGKTKTKIIIDTAANGHIKTMARCILAPLKIHRGSYVFCSSDEGKRTNFWKVVIENNLAMDNA